MLSDCVRTVISTKNSYKWELISVSEKVDNGLIDRINKNSAMIIGGGGLFLPDTNKNDISGWQWACSKELMEKIEVPIIAFAIGYNYFYGQEPNQLFVDNLKYFADKVSFMGLRNTGSIGKIKSIVGECKNNIDFCPCPTTLIRKIYSNLPKKIVSKNVAVNFAFDRIDRRLGDNKENILKEVARAIKAIENMGYNIYYVLHRDDDAEFITYLTRENISIRVYNLTDYSPRKIIDFYNNMELVIGARGHSQMIPFGVNCKIISLSTHEKMKWFLEDIDLLDYFIDLKNKENVFERIISCFENIEKDKYIIEKLVSKQEYLFDITKKNLEKLSPFIKKGEVL